MTNLLIYDLTFEELSDWITTQDHPDFRTKQIWEGLYKHCYQSFSEFTNIPKSMRISLEENFVTTALTQRAHLKSKDANTEKTLFELRDGAMIETVLMHYNNRRSLCISTQSGCTMGCVFCATGQMGFDRNLSSGEIISQGLFFEQRLREHNQNLTNIVLMGMGEPFLNYNASIQTIRQLNNPNGFNMGARRFTISTVGIIPKIRQFAGEGLQANLAISLHATEDTLRSSIVPINRLYPIGALINACNEYIEKTHRRVTFEYALIEGVNDSNAHAIALAELLKGMLCHVNLISLNPTQGYQNGGSKQPRVDAFLQVLISMKIQATVRLRRGIEIQAGCGQLAYQKRGML